MTEPSSAAGPDKDTSVPFLNLDLERTRLEFRETVREIEGRVNVVERYRRWRERADGADRAFPVAIVAGVVILGIATAGVIQAVREHR
ncbi:hypothetical protein [Labedella endophytica]|uniref:DUF3618 domain-containing protein n=1 Tax=Labedella endophytica TaxID=1523160 RepID=A0A433JVS0_9MICO|nr:hypothetical protein [Labedella endophytica]RUR03282.1 hypothetical protein ELQ94_01660 [Labedella endophytica]